MLPKLLAKLVAPVVTLLLNIFPFATNPKGTISVIEKTRPQVVCALVLGDSKGPGENIGDRCNSSHPRCTSGTHEIRDYPARECMGEGDSRVSFVERLRGRRERMIRSRPFNKAGNSAPQSSNHYKSWLSPPQP